MTGDGDVAEDAVAEAIARAWREIKRGRQFENLAGWIRVVALNHARRTFRRRAVEQRARERVARETRSVAPPGESADGDLRAVLAELSEREREVAVLRWLLHVPVTEIAHDLAISPATVDNYLRRARAKLRGALTRPVTREGQFL